jgi:cytochrome c1
VIDPGKTGRLRVSFNPRGQRQVLARSITIHSNDPERPALVIKVSAEVVPPGEEKMPQAPAAAKRAHPPESKLVLEGKCLKCHGPKSQDQKGARLFASGCAACHGEGGQGVRIDRESIGPPLRLTTMTVKTRAGLTQVISAGTGHPAMPGFGKSYGGPLTDTQVASLVQLVLKGFPAR